MGAFTADKGRPSGLADPDWDARAECGSDK